MKKSIFALILLGLLVGCSTVNNSLHDNENDVEVAIDQDQILGYWIKIEGSEWTNDEVKVTDYRKNSNYFLEITESQLFFINYYFDSESYAEVVLYYKLDTNKMFFDATELTGPDYQDNLSDLSGGVYRVSFDELGNLELTKYHDDTMEIPLVQELYQKIPATQWPITQ